MTGISNGGYMSILASTYFDDKIKAFAPVSAGDPYGTHFDSRKELTARKGAPGLFIDNETGKSDAEDNAAVANSYPHEQEWHTANPSKKPAFKLFYNVADKLVDVSCKRKAEQLLEQHGYSNAGSFVIQDGGKKTLLAHFWLGRYNQPMIEFFKTSRR